MPVPVIPVWTIPPNWSKPVVERLAWLSDVLTSRSGAEQRRAVRLTPRRNFEFQINPLDNVRTFLDLWLHSIADMQCFLPLWHDHAKLTATAASGSSRLNFDNTYREHMTDGFAILWADAFTWEVVNIEAQDATGLDLAEPLNGTWNQRASVFPVRLAYLDPEVTSRALTSRVGEAVLEFAVNEANPFDGGAETLTLYEGTPVITLEPNRLDALETQYRRVMDEIDLQIGLRSRYDEAERSFQTQFYNWRAKGRQERQALRQLLYRLNGKQKAVWLPSFNEDVRLTTALSPAQSHINISKVGYAYTGGAVSGREHLAMFDDAGVQRFAKIVGTGAPPSTTQERLNLSAASGFSAAAGRTASFLSKMRLDSDELEITHYHDSEGLCEVTAPLKAFKDSRVAPAVLLLPTPAAEMNFATCGSPEGDNSCVPVFGYEPVFNGWYARARITIEDTPQTLAGWYVDPDTSNSIFNNFNNIWPATNAEFPGGIPYRVFDPDFKGATIYWCNADVMATTVVDLRHQFPAGTGAKQGRFSWQFWTDEFTQEIAPFAGDSGGSPFLIGSLFPQNWYFNV